MGKCKKEKGALFIEVIGDPNATKSDAAQKSMALLLEQINKIKKRPKKIFA